MCQEHNKAIGYRFIDLFDQHDVSIADEIFGPNFKSNVPLAPTLDKEGWKAYMQATFDGLPDLYQEVEDMIATDDHLVLQIMYRGTHKGEYIGIPPTGKSVSFRAIGVNRIENGLIVKNTVAADILSVMQQIGVIHFPGQNG